MVISIYSWLLSLEKFDYGPTIQPRPEMRHVLCPFERSKDARPKWVCLGYVFGMRMNKKPRWSWLYFISARSKRICWKWQTAEWVAIHWVCICVTIVTYCMVLTTSKFQKTMPTKAAGGRGGSVIAWSILDAPAVNDSFHQGERPLPISPGTWAGNKVVRSRCCCWLWFLSPEGLPARECWMIEKVSASRPQLGQVPRRRCHLLKRSRVVHSMASETRLSKVELFVCLFVDVGTGLTPRAAQVPGKLLSINGCQRSIDDPEW